MKLSRVVVLFCVLGATLMLAQNNNLPNVQHVIVIIQENRTPTNLFQTDRQNLPGAHIVTAGYCDNNQWSLTPTDLYICWDPRHRHQDWTAMWHNGQMDEACHVSIAWEIGNGGWCTSKPPCVNAGTCPYTYVQNRLFGGGHHILDPYFRIAEQYGFANYMFQTNQGPSYPAHLFLLSGTSAPDSYNSDRCDSPYTSLYCYQWFAAENNNSYNHAWWGCTAPSGNIWEIEPSGAEYLNIYNNGYPCYHHATLADLLNPAVSWRYYARSATGLWTAPNSIYNICQPLPGHAPGDYCSGTDWVNNVQNVLPDQGGYSSAPILDDIEAIDRCRLPQVSWVIPDGNWSDHAGGNNVGPGDGGPSWVAAIVNAVGNSYDNSGQKCDYWGQKTDPSDPRHQPTVVLITWDDWGGYYDDVVPPDCPGPGQCSGYFNTGNSGNGKQYVYSFRVPLLVVGAFVTQGYISGGGVFPPDCQHNTYCHDFGSILNFIEYAFGTGGVPLGGGTGIGDPAYPYADALVMDRGQAPNNYSLYDFFNFAQQPRVFQPITGWKYPENCFKHPTDPGCFTTYPSDPDNDANETD